VDTTKLDLSVIDVKLELNRIGWTYEPGTDDWLKVNCPLHDDKSASCGINTKERYFTCRAAGCGAHGDIVAFLAGALKQSRALIILELYTRYNLRDELTIEPGVVEKDHAAIWDCAPILAELRKRGVTDSDIRKYRIGARMVKGETRCTIPIKNEAGFCVNIRKYKPGAAGADKMRNEPRCGKIRLFPIEQLNYQTVMICGGELKAIVAAAELNALENPIGAITTTGGEGSWDGEFSQLFKGKRVYVCFDIDLAGRQGAAKICGYLRRVAEFVGLVPLPLDPDRYPTGDINDFVVNGGKLFDLLANVEAFQPPQIPVHKIDVDPIDTEFSAIMRSENTSKVIRFTGRILGDCSKVFSVPKRVTPSCPKDQPFCGLCPVFAMEDGQSHDVDKSDTTLLQYISEPLRMRNNADKELLGVPKACRVVEFAHDETYTLAEVEICSPDGLGGGQFSFWFPPDNRMASVDTYTFTGCVTAFPRNSLAVMFAWEHEIAEDAISNYVKPQGNHLEIFRPDEWTLNGVANKIKEIHEDIAHNVLRIYFRNDMLLLADLAYHSVLEIPFNGMIERGWVDVCIVGDSGQGKTQTFKGLHNFYALGEHVDCKNMSAAGLLATTRQGASGQYMVSAGKFPQQNGRLIILEEFKGLNNDVLAKLTEVRSSGKLSITKAGTAEFQARVRLIVLSNPLYGAVDNYTFGINAIESLIGEPEDIRRFDAALIVSKDEVDPDSYSDLQMQRSTVPRKYLANTCRELIVFAWTRKAEQIDIPRDTMLEIMRAAKQFTTEFTDKIPLVDSTMKQKLAKLSTAVAVRTFSTSENMERVIVRPCHVQFVARELRRIYSSETFGYAKYSFASNKSLKLDEALLSNEIFDLALSKTFVEMISFADKITAQDIHSWIDADDNAESAAVVSWLVRSNAIKRDASTNGLGTVYCKTPNFIQYLAKDSLQSLNDRPRRDKF
jgi:hypothetical protein